MTGLVGSLQEAWGEVRVHRARVVLSLVGVVLAVFAMTVVTAAGTIAGQVVQESGERMSGRSTTLSVYANGKDGAMPAPGQAEAAYSSLIRRFGVEYSSMIMQVGGEVPSPGGTMYVDMMLVEPDYGIIHRITPIRGRWLMGADAERLAPTAVVNSKYLEFAGIPGASPPFSIEIPGEVGSRATVVGVTDLNLYSPQLTMLMADRDALPDSLVGGATPGLEMWVPPQHTDEIMVATPWVLEGLEMTGEAFPMSDESLPGIITAVQWGVRALSWAALGLGALGVLNVGIVTVRQRVREIGVRRALGASSSRVFAAVMLESVCATALAGLVGVALAVAVMVNLPLDSLLGEAGITDVPPFPFSAALEAFLAATAVGALAGLVPATIAVRSKVVDAIRY